MNKIAIKNNNEKIVDLDFPLKKNISNLSESLNKDKEELTVCLLDRPRHKKIIDELVSMKVKLKLITDGDVSGSLLVSDNRFNVDMFIGVGGGPPVYLSYCDISSLLLVVI